MVTEYYEHRWGNTPNPTWIINYDPERALHNYRYISRESVAAVAIFASTHCGAFVVTNVPLKSITEPHVVAWRDSFKQITEMELLARLPPAGHEHQVTEGPLAKLACA